MKYFLLGCIKAYQILPFSSHIKCRYVPSCSNYAMEAIMYYGAWKGSILAIKRIGKCNPWHKGGYDPLIKE